MKQYDFDRYWRKAVKPVLNKPSVVRALNVGMFLQDDAYKPGDPPWEHGRGPQNGQQAKERSLSWYQPWGRCHYIVAVFRSLEWYAASFCHNPEAALDLLRPRGQPLP